MNIDIDKVANIVRMMDAKHSLNGKDVIITEEYVDKLLEFAVSFIPDFSNEEKEAARNDFNYRHQVYSPSGESILADYDMEAWYDDVKKNKEPVFWTRYKNYLIDEKHFSPNVVSTLGEDTLDQKLMNYILNPEVKYDKAVLRRGLIIGDVQSGKTSTYIGFICKAADVGYKVFILLTGTIETLRKQTQERVEEGFIGIDMSASTTGGKRVGVGLDNQPIKAMALTSRHGDFAGDSNKIAVALSDKNAVVFVIKKQKDVLTKLKDWLVTLNANPITGKIDIPMLMIDDEADNASINTSKSKEDPTTINKLIRELASVFTISNYVGFTATPFANVFIDPETTEKMATQDLFPEDFIVALPTPSNYIGPNRVFAEDGEFHSQLNYITDAGIEEEDGMSFYFKHKKEWEGELPESLTDSIYAFYLANAIRDLRGDNKEHRSMLVNISRFIKVQKHTKNEIEMIHAAAYRAIKFNLSNDFNKSMKDPILNRMYRIWKEQYEKCEFSWDDIAKTLFKSMESIQIKVVNSSKSSEKLEYPKNESLRVIAIGGLALSRGLTLEGLIISYFYRNTCTYDVLMQMGRWFGYRKNYEDLFRIWTHKASANWYAEIAEATEQLKSDMTLMRDRGQKPKDFGIRVRNNSAELNITAYNKMRNATDEFEYLSYYGGIIETPYIHFNTDIQKKNYESVEQFVDDLVSAGYSFERQATEKGKGHYIIQDIPKVKIVELIRKLKISKFSSDFDTKQISDFLENTAEPSIALFDVAFMEGAETTDKDLIVNIAGRNIPKVIRGNCVIDKETDRLGIGRRGKLGGPGDGRTGIIDFDGNKSIEIINYAKEQYKIEYKRNHGVDFIDGKTTYPSSTWFKYVEKRKPILLFYLIDISVSEDECNQQKQINEFKQKMNGTPAVGVALGLPRNDNAAQLSCTKYKTNSKYNWFEQEAIEQEGIEE